MIEIMEVNEEGKNKEINEGRLDVFQKMCKKNLQWR